MEQAALIERYTTAKDKQGKAVTRSETVPILTTASADQAPSADLLALNRGHWAATEATHWVRDADLKEDPPEHAPLARPASWPLSVTPPSTCFVYTASPTSPPNAAASTAPTARFSSEWASQQAK
jgi:hypothetical protein